ncbi:AarF/UbiB family protein [Kovacikia minuta]|uniref:AarF/UbiB family protein n=1 Tax=Kovacikia minuta TaxID=2931930 RepID=UPI0036F260E2
MGQHPLHNLRRYNAGEIAQYYRYRPWKSFWRTFRIVLAFLSFFLGLKLDDWRNVEATTRLKRAEQLRETLTRLGPTFIKVGQALSTRPDLIRKDFLDELVKLQDQLPPFPTEAAFTIIETELERSVDEVFSQISPDPVAAASLGQVYQARLYSGEEVGC